MAASSSDFAVSLFIACLDPYSLGRFEGDTMGTVNRAWANNQLRHCRNSALLTLAAMQMINSNLSEVLNDKLIVITPNEMIFNAGQADRKGKRYEVNLGQIATEFRSNQPRLVESLEELWKFVRRNLCKESFEVTKAYANSVGCFSALQAASWYPYARTVRNSISHDFHFRFTARDLSRLPVTWNGRIIDASMHGKDLTNDLLDPYTSWSLHDEMVAFVNTH